MATAMSLVGRVNQSPQESAVSFAKSSRHNDQTKVSKELLDTKLDGGYDSGFLFTMERDRQVY